MRTIVVATQNKHKIAEISAIIAARARCVGVTEFGEPPKVIEDATTFEGNALKKAETIALWLRRHGTADPDANGEIWILADDSGLEVDAIGGAPGVRSARYASPPGDLANSSDSANNEKLLRELGAAPRSQRSARFRCTIALVPMTLDGDGGLRRMIFSGACEGWINFESKGRGGFGYDPLFIPTGFDLSFAELGEHIKNSISHRSVAMNGVIEWLDSASGKSAQSANNEIFAYGKTSPNRLVEGRG